MRKQLIFSMVLFFGVQVAYGQGGEFRVVCGYERDSDFDGVYASSTSPDQCALAQPGIEGGLTVSGFPQAVGHGAFLAMDHFTSTFLPLRQQYSADLEPGFAPVGQLRLHKKRVKQIASGLPGTIAIAPNARPALLPPSTIIQFPGFRVQQQIGTLPAVFTVANGICPSEFPSEAMRTEVPAILADALNRGAA